MPAVNIQIRNWLISAARLSCVIEFAIALSNNEEKWNICRTSQNPLRGSAVILNLKFIELSYDEDRRMRLSHSPLRGSAAILNLEFLELSYDEDRSMRPSHELLRGSAVLLNLHRLSRGKK